MNPAKIVENYIVCQPGGRDNFVSSSVPGKCFRCKAQVMLTPATQEHIQKNSQKNFRIVCMVCYQNAPDKNYIR